MIIRVQKIDTDLKKKLHVNNNIEDLNVWTYVEGSLYCVSYCESFSWRGF